MPTEWKQSDSNFGVPQNQSKPTIENLPPEMVFEILKYLPPKDIDKLRVTNKEMYEFIAESLYDYIKSTNQFVDVTGGLINVETYKNNFLLLDWRNGLITTRTQYEEFKNFDRELSVLDPWTQRKLLNRWHAEMIQWDAYRTKIYSYVKWLRGQNRLVSLETSYSSLTSKMSDKRVFNRWRTAGTIKWIDKS